MSQINNIIHRNQSKGLSPTDRKVISVEKRFPKVVEEKSEGTDVVEVVKEEVTPPVKNDDVRATKRAEFSVLEKARKLEADAKEKLKRAEELSAAYDSKDLDRIAKAYNMSTSDYVRWVNAKMIGSPTEKTLTPAEMVQEQARKWQETMENKVKELDYETQFNKKMGYINKNILPHLIKNPEKYELLTEDMDASADTVYTFMNQHFIETKEELDPVELLDALEGKYLKDWQDEESKRQERKAKIKKLQAQEVLDKKADVVAKPGSGKHISAPKAAEPKLSEEDQLAAALAGGEVDEDVLAKDAPSNLIAGATRGTTAKSTDRRTIPSYGTTPKSSPHSRESPLAPLSKPPQCKY